MDKILILVLLILLYAFSKLMKQDSFSPALINFWWNAFFIIGAVFVFSTGTPLKYAGIYWTIVACFSFLAGQIMGGCFRLKKGRKINMKNKNYVYVILIGIILLGFCSPLIYIRAFGYSVSDLFHIKALIELNSSIAYDRYSGHTFHESVFSILISIIIYIGALVGGYLFPSMKKLMGKLLSLAVMIPILLVAIVTNAKVGLIACVFLWAIGWILYTLNWKQEKTIISKRLLAIGIGIAVVGVAFLDFTMLMRIGSINHETQLIVNNKLQAYAFGQVNSFSVWFDNRGSQGLDFGSNTYMFFTNWLGITARTQGVYDIMPGVVSNVYTQNRGIIMDFGVIGGLVYWFALGIVSGVTYKKVKSGSNHCMISTLILGTIYFMVLYGFIISPWIYTSYVLAFVGFGMFLAVLKIFNFSFKR